jgi:protein-S-isoprenylcysteine O-methyltransferase Ste14
MSHERDLKSVRPSGKVFSRTPTLLCRKEELHLTNRSRPNTLPWPPIIYIIAAVQAYAVQKLWPLPWFESSWNEIAMATGVLLVLAAIAIEVTVIQAFRRHATTILPHRGATNLITTGLFAKSRKPIYLGNTLLLAGISVFLGNAWMLASVPFAVIAVTKLAIEREEGHLLAKFGPAWQAYASRVRRWL